MEGDHPISLLLVGTFAVVAIVLVLLIIGVMRKRSNRHPMDGQRERNIAEIRDEGPVER